jgi:hypothetical protein
MTDHTTKALDALDSPSPAFDEWDGAYIKLCVNLAPAMSQVVRAAAGRPWWSKVIRTDRDGCIEGRHHCDGCGALATGSWTQSHRTRNGVCGVIYCALIPLDAALDAFEAKAKEVVQ